MKRRAILLAFLLFMLGGAGFVYHRLSRPPQKALDALTALSERADIVAALTSKAPATPRQRRQRDANWSYSAASFLQTPLSRQLAQDRTRSDGHIRQIMVMDRGGALIAADAPTHDYDQSDEPKWQRTVGAHNNAPVIEGQSREAGGNVWQMSQSVRGPDGRIIGAITLRWR